MLVYVNKAQVSVIIASECNIYCKTDLSVEYLAYPTYMIVVTKWFANVLLKIFVVESMQYTIAITPNY